MSWRAWHDHRDELDPPAVAAIRHGLAAAAMFAIAYLALDGLGWAESPAGHAALPAGGLRVVVVLATNLGTVIFGFWGVVHALACGQIALWAVVTRFRR